MLLRWYATGVEAIDEAVSGPMRAALNLYAADPAVFDLEARVVAGLFASQAAMLLHGSEQVVHLGRAVDSRDVIGQAKGVLMTRGADPDEAFATLRRISQDRNIKLREVATVVVDLESGRAARTRPPGR